MNKIFKTVWNRVRRCYVAVNETVTGAAQSSGKSAAIIGVTLATSILAANNVDAQVSYEDLEFSYVSSGQSQYDRADS